MERTGHGGDRAWRGQVMEGTGHGGDRAWRGQGRGDRAEGTGHGGDRAEGTEQNANALQDYGEKILHSCFNFASYLVRFTLPPPTPCRDVDAVYRHVMHVTGCLEI